MAASTESIRRTRESEARNFAGTTREISQYVDCYPLESSGQLLLDGTLEVVLNDDAAQ